MSNVNVRASKRKMKSGKIVNIKPYNKRIKDIVAPLFNDAKNAKELVDAYKKSKIMTVTHVIKKYELNPATHKNKIKRKSNSIFDKHVEPMFKKSLSELRNKPEEKKSTSKVGVLHFGNFHEVGDLKNGDTIYSRNISEDKDWQETLKKGGKAIKINSNGTILTANILALTPKGVMNIGKFQGTQKEIKKFIKKGAKIK